MRRLDRFIAESNAAYYAAHDPFTDFTTAPEITQMFGEILGAWSVMVWRQMGAPNPVLWVEAGPGRGTLMRDALRALTKVAPDFAAAARLHLIETSVRLRDIQAGTLGQATWHDRLDSLPGGPVLLLANEFLDALPIRQFVRRGNGWAERYVADARFFEVPVTTALAIPLPVPEGAVVEVGDAALSFARDLASRIVRFGGTALLLDYGPARSCHGETLQALRDGAPANPLAHFGAADLTAHVDFARVAEAASGVGAAIYGPLAQGALLERLGLFVRAGQLAAGKAPKLAVAIMEAAQRLAASERMGSLFKALVISHPKQPIPPGFEA